MRVDAHLGGRRVDQPLHVVVALGPPGAAIGAHCRGIGEHTGGRHLDQRRGVDADGVLGRVPGRGQRRRVAEIGAEIAPDFQPHGEEAAFGVQRQRRLNLVVASMAVGQEALGPLVRPLDRRAEALGGQQQAWILRVDGRLHAERAADVERQDVQLVLADAQHVLEHVAHAEHALAAQPKRVAASLEHADGGARLHGGDDDAAVADGQVW